MKYSETKGTALGKWQKEARDGGICGKCKQEYMLLTVEHIIPVHLLVQMGLAEVAYNDDENFELLCKGCNGIKSSRLDMFHPKTIPLLARYVEMARLKYLKTV